MTYRQAGGRCGAALLFLGAALPLPALAQNKAAVEQERREFAEWLRTAPTSPKKAVVVRPISSGLTVGPASADIPLSGVAEGRLTETDGRATLRTGAATTPLARGRVTAVGTWKMVVTGPPGRGIATVYGAGAIAGKPLIHFPYDPASVHTVTLTPAGVARSQRLLAPDGVEVDATDAGTVALTLGGQAVTLRVMRLPGATEDETELEIYFRDATSGKETYPAGRFVSLIPAAGGRYTLDFNRARNPFCAYNTVYPCPAPWRGNALAAPVRAGERYAGGGLDTPAPGD